MSGVVDDWGRVDEGSSVDKWGMVDNGSGMNHWGKTDGVNNGLHGPHNWDGVVNNGLNSPDDWDGVVNHWGGSHKGGPGVGVVGWGVNSPHNWSWGNRDDWLVNGDDTGSRGGSVGEG